MLCQPRSPFIGNNREGPILHRLVQSHSVFLQDPSPDTIKKKKSTLAVVIVHTRNCCGDPRMKEQRRTSFCQKQGEDSESPYTQSFVGLSQNPDMRNSGHSRHTCLSVASCPPLSLSIRFPRQPMLDLS